MRVWIECSSADVVLLRAPTASPTRFQCSRQLAPVSTHAGLCGEVIIRSRLLLATLAGQRRQKSVDFGRAGGAPPGSLRTGQLPVEFMSMNPECTPLPRRCAVGEDDVIEIEAQPFNTVDKCGMASWCSRPGACRHEQQGRPRQPDAIPSRRRFRLRTVTRLLAGVSVFDPTGVDGCFRGHVPDHRYLLRRTRAVS